MTYVYTSSLPCPVCGSKISEVRDSRGVADASYIRRRRICDKGHPYTTQERVTSGWTLVPSSKRHALLTTLIETANELRTLEEREV